MRPFLGLLALSAPLAVGSVALSATIAVDFTAVPGSTDITFPNSYTINGLEVSFDPQGNLGQSASISSSGISGTTNGALNLAFTEAVVQGMKFDWTIQNVSGQPGDPGLIFLTDAGDLVLLDGTYEAYDPETPDLGFVSGRLDYSGPVFMVGTAYFSLGTDPLVPTFTLTNFSYQVPEPTAIAGVLAASGGLLIRKRVAKAAR